MNIEELERLYGQTLMGQPDYRDFMTAVTLQWPQILARLKAAEEWCEAYKEFLRVDRSEPGLAKWDAATVRLDAAEAALIAVHEEDGNG